LEKSITDLSRPKKTLLWRIGKTYRRLFSGLCFLFFMTSALFLTVFVVTPMSWLPLSAARKHRWGLGLVRRALRLFTRIMCVLGIIARFRVQGLEHALDRGPVLFLANHPTLIDVVTILGVLPRCNCIVKKALFHHRYMGGVVRGCGLIPNVGGQDLIDRVEVALERGNSLMIFPEGTRSPPEGLHPFNRGAARLALHCGLPIVPVVVRCEPPTLRKGSPWWDVPDRPMDFSLQFHPPREVAELVDMSLPMPLRARALTRTLQAYFEEHTGRNSAQTGP